MSNFVQPCGLQPTRLLCPWGSPGKNTGVGCHAFLQGIFPTQGWNLGLLPCKRILYCLSHQGSPRILEWVAYPFSRGSSPHRNSLLAELLGKPIHTLWPSTYFPRHIAHPFHSLKYICSPKGIYWNVHSSICTDGSQFKTPRCLLIENKLFQSHTATKKEESVFHITTWINLTNLILSERGKTQRIQMTLFHLYLLIVQEQVELLMGLEVSFLVTFGEEQEH